MIPYRRGVHWWKIKNRAYSQAEGRHELFNGEKRHHRLERDFARHSRGLLSTAGDSAGDGM